MNSSGDPWIGSKSRESTTESLAGSARGAWGEFTWPAIATCEQGGWGTIASQPDWGRVKLGHTHPEHFKSGLLTLVLMAYEFFNKERTLSHADLAQPAFQKWPQEFERAVARPDGTLSSSTGTLMMEMVPRGPSQYDCAIIYENLAIEYLEAARDRWGELRVDYPDPNFWNEHPYYILDVPWSDRRQRTAASEFLEFLMSEPIQKPPGNEGPQLLAKASIDANPTVLA